MNAFRLLKADEIECRISRVSEKSVFLLLYKTARTDADLLDETVGATNWTNDFKVIDGVLYGGIGVDYGNGLVWKWDAGTESNMEAEKGRASDAFKRAGFKHGIGRELYSAPEITVWASKCNIKNGKCYDVFVVTEIGYDTHERIKRLVIENTTKGVVAFSYESESAKNVRAIVDEFSKGQPYPTVICEKCGEQIKPVRVKGQIKSVEYQIDGSQKMFGKNYCYSCSVAVNKGEDNANA